MTESSHEIGSAAGIEAGLKAFLAGPTADDPARAPGFAPQGIGACDAIWQHYCIAGEDDPAAAHRTGPDWADCLMAGAAYARVIGKTWQRIAVAYAGERAAHPAMTEWQTLRDRWFAIAEAEFLKTLRGEPFILAQKAVIRRVAAWHESLPADVRERLRATRSGTGRIAAEVTRLGLSPVAIATTPAQRIWREGRVSLHRYVPLTGAVPARGTVVVAHGLIGRQSMTDLLPDRSVVRDLLAAGVDVCAVDWGNATPADRDRGFAHHVGVLRRALAEARRTAAGPLTLMGICQGGTLASCLMALHPDAADRLILAVAPVDFHADGADPDPAHGLLHHWMRALEDSDVERLIALDGNLSGQFIGQVFAQLNPVRTLAKYTVGLAERARSPDRLRMFMAMETWLADRPDLPGAMAHEWLVGLYRHNLLARGAFRIGGRRVDLGRIAVPVLNIHAEADHITPPPCSRALARFVPPERYRELALPTGHIGAFVSAASQPRLVPGILEWLDNEPR